MGFMCVWQTKQLTRWICVSHFPTETTRTLAKLFWAVTSPTKTLSGSLVNLVLTLLCVYPTCWHKFFLYEYEILLFFHKALKIKLAKPRAKPPPSPLHQEVPLSKLSLKGNALLKMHLSLSYSTLNTLFTNVHLNYTVHNNTHSYGSPSATHKKKTSMLW